MVYIGKDLWKEGLDNYLKSKKPWEHNFKDEFTIQDTEQSILSKMIWESLFNVYFDDKIEMTISKETYVECSLKNSDDSSFRVYFDVMNNNEQIEGIYHRVGNYTVYPQMEGMSLQIIHNWHGEKWDDFLGWLRENWEKERVTYETKKKNPLWYVQSESFRDKNGLVFKEYMILICQQMYYKEIYDTIHEKNIEERSVQNDTNTIRSVPALV